MATEKVGLTLRINTLKGLKLWGAMLDLEEHDTVTACLANWLPRLVEKEAAPLRRAFTAIVDAADLHELTKGVFAAEAPLEPRDVHEGLSAEGGPVRQVAYRLDGHVGRALRLFCTLSRRRMSEVANEAISRRLIELARSRGNRFWNVYSAAIIQTRYDEDRHGKRACMVY